MRSRRTQLQRVKTMEKEKIELAAKEYADKQGDFCTGWYHAVDDFIHGARWRINSVWHKAENELPEYDKLVLAEYETNGIKDYVFSHRSDNPYVKTNGPGFAFYIEGVRITRWAYLADLLPDGKEAEP